MSDEMSKLFRCCSLSRSKLWSHIYFVSEAVLPELQLRIDILLKGSIARTFEDVTFREMTFTNTIIGKECPLNSVVFFACQFNEVIFNLSNLFNIVFIDCTFFSCKSDGKAQEEASSKFMNCRSEPECFLTILEHEELENNFLGTNEDAVFERLVLERFWSPGKLHFSTQRAQRTLYLGHETKSYQDITGAIKRLRHRRIIIFKKDYAKLNMNALNEIRHILGRTNHGNK